MTNDSKWYHRIARAGYSAKTIMYVMLGTFILSSVINSLNREKATQSRVFETLKEQPFGQFLLGGLVIGLACYALWRWLQTFTESTSNDDSKLKATITKCFFFISGLFYMAAAFVGAKILFSWRQSQSGDSKDSSQEISSYLMQFEWGLLLVAAIGVGIIVFSGIQFKHAYTKDFLEKFTMSSLSSGIQKSISFSGRMGYVARGVVYLVVGGFFILAALVSNPSEAGGLQKVLSTLMEQPFGPYLIAGVGAGFVMFGLYCGLEAKYRDLE